MYYGKERKYNKIPMESIKSAHRTQGGKKTKFAKGYENMSWQERIKSAALKASDNGRCWWVYDYIMRTSLQRREV
tara:strand:+ start:955 stop:1179 length:225 start_codon:yes stop_codon:yes gene_type:complete